MKIGDIYKNKENNSIIQIDSFATPMGRFCEEKTIIVFRKIENEIGSCPSFNGYGTQEEIEADQFARDNIISGLRLYRIPKVYCEINNIHNMFKKLYVYVILYTNLILSRRKLFS